MRNINIVVRLIFKNTKDQSAITAMSQGTSASTIQSQIDENRLKEIQKIASTMKVNIPKRFESKTAIREFIQSREFIAAMKQSMNSQLFLCINSSNKILTLVTAKLEKQQRMHGGGNARGKEKDSKDAGANGGSGPPGSSYRDNGPSNGTGLNSPHKRANPNLLENGKSNRKRSLVNGSTADANPPQKGEGRHGGHINNKRGSTHESSMGKTGSNFNHTQSGFGEKEKKTKKKDKHKQNDAAKAQHQRARKEPTEFEKELDQLIQEEAVRRDEEELEPMTKDDRQKLKDRLVKEKERLNEKEKLLQITQKYYIGPGNNHQVVKNVIKQRYWWTQAPSEDFQDANFIWTSWKRDKHIEYLKQKGQNELDVPIKMYGRLNNNKHLSNKKGIFVNMRDYYTMTGVDPFSILPLTFLIQNSNDAEYRKLEREHNRIARTQKQNRQTANKLISEHLAKKKKELIAKGQRP